jgi:nicotinamide riboside transporter PnuC
MIPVWWSIMLTAVGVTGLWIAGRRSAWGWVIGLGAQVLWVAYAVATRQWGFIGSALAYGFVYGRNALRWHRERER